MSNEFYEIHKGQIQMRSLWGIEMVTIMQRKKKKHLCDVAMDFQGK